MKLRLYGFLLNYLKIVSLRQKKVFWKNDRSYFFRLKYLKNILTIDHEIHGYIILGYIGPNLNRSLKKRYFGKIDYFLSAICLPNYQLWATIMGKAWLTQC